MHKTTFTLASIVFQRGKEERAAGTQPSASGGESLNGAHATASEGEIKIRHAPPPMAPVQKRKPRLIF